MGIAILVLLGGAVAGLGAGRLRQPPIPAEVDPPSAYRITYAVTTPGETPPRSTQTLTVRRPYEGRNETRSEAGYAGLVASAEGAWRLQADGTATFLGPKSPSTPAGDARPLLSIRDAVAHKLVRRAGAGRVAGRRCTRFAMAEPLGRPLSAPGPLTRTDLCVDDRGLVLEERWTQGRKLTRMRRATRVELGPSLTADAFGPAPATARLGLAGIDARRVARVVRIPTGFREDGAFALGENGLVEAFVRGPDLLLVEQSRTGPAPWTPVLGSYATDAGALGKARVVLDLVAPQLRIQLPGGGYVRLSGSLTPAGLAAAARSMELLDKMGSTDTRN